MIGHAQSGGYNSGEQSESYFEGGAGGSMMKEELARYEAERNNGSKSNARGGSKYNKSSRGNPVVTVTNSNITESQTFTTDGGSDFVGGDQYTSNISSSQAGITGGSNISYGREENLGGDVYQSAMVGDGGDAEIVGGSTYQSAIIGGGGDNEFVGGSNYQSNISGGGGNSEFVGGSNYRSKISGGGGNTNVTSHTYTTVINGGSGNDLQESNFSNGGGNALMREELANYQSGGDSEYVGGSGYKKVISSGTTSKGSRKNFMNKAFNQQGFKHTNATGGDLSQDSTKINGGARNFHHSRGFQSGKNNSRATNVEETNTTSSTHINGGSRNIHHSRGFQSSRDDSHVETRNTTSSTHINGGSRNIHHSRGFQPESEEDHIITESIVIDSSTNNGGTGN